VFARLPECQDWSHGEVERGWEHGVGCRAGSETECAMTTFTRGERVEIITPGWTACPLGVVFANAGPADNRYCVEPDDGYRHHYLRIIEAADLRARAGHELQAEDERSRLPMCGAARVLAGRFGCSERQARRYVEVAARSGELCWFPSRRRCSRSRCRPVLRSGCGSMPGCRGGRSPLWWPRRWRSFSRAAAGTIPAGERAGSRSGIRVRPPRGRGIVGGLQDHGPRRAGPQHAGRSGRTVPR